MNYLLALFAGIILPFSAIRLYDILRNTFLTKQEIENYSPLPVVGGIYKNNKNVEAVVPAFPKSHITESFRILRTKLNYFISEPEQSNIIVITSLISQDGKSFISLNLAITLALSQKKVILLGFDLRKPKLYERIDIIEKQGISEYLSKQALLDDIIQKTNVPNLDCIYAGGVPPNPAELVASGRLDSLFEDLKSAYDFIIVDTAPFGIVSESFDLIEKADLKLIVVKLNHTPKREMLSLANELKTKNLKNACLVVNDIPLMKKARYGYGYYEMS